MPMFLLLVVAGLVTARLVGLFLVENLGATRPPAFASSPSAWIGVVCTATLTGLWVLMELGQAASSDVHSGLGELGLPFYWAGIFAPFLVCRYWGPESIWRPSRSRGVLLLLMLAGTFGWYANQQVWV